MQVSITSLPIGDWSSSLSVGGRAGPNGVDGWTFRAALTSSLKASKASMWNCRQIFLGLNTRRQSSEQVTEVILVFKLWICENIITNLLIICVWIVFSQYYTLRLEQPRRNYHSLPGFQSMFDLPESLWHVPFFCWKRVLKFVYHLFPGFQSLFYPAQSLGHIRFQCCERVFKCIHLLLRKANGFESGKSSSRVSPKFL